MQVVLLSSKPTTAACQHSRISRQLTTTNLPKSFWSGSRHQPDDPPDTAAQDPLSHSHLDMLHTTPSGPSVIQNQHDTGDVQNQHDSDDESRFRDLMAHTQYISFLHHGLVNAAKDPSCQARYIEGLAAALLEFSTLDTWEIVKEIGKHNAGPLLSIMQNVRPSYDLGAIC
jgi:hypothetical protein